MKTSSEVKTIMPSFIKALAEIGHAIKDAQNPHFKNDYATLESTINASKTILAKHDLALCQTVTIDNVLVTTIFHKSGEMLQSEMKLLLNKQDMQQLGSALSYARRYSILSMLNMAQEDDDAQAVSHPAKVTAPAAAPKVKAQEHPSISLNLTPPAAIYKIANGKNKGRKIEDMSNDEIQSQITQMTEYYEKQKEAPYGSFKDDLRNMTKYLEEQAELKELK